VELTIKGSSRQHPVVARLHPGGECCDKHSYSSKENATSSSSSSSTGGQLSEVNEDACPTAAYRASCVLALQKAGMRVTSPRIAVIDCIAASSVPLSAPAIFEQLKQNQTNVSKSSTPDKVSVYRVLEALCKLGLVHQVLPDGGYIACFHRHCDSAYHVVTNCEVCGAVKEVDVPREVVDLLIRQLETTQSFLANQHLLQIGGRCVACASNSER
jgi:Fe2+ or Zn2+ uptake regulation protein